MADQETVAITLRISKEWRRDLEAYARKVALEHNRLMNVQELIRVAIFKTFISKDIRGILNREGRMSELAQLNCLKSILERTGYGVVK